MNKYIVRSDFPNVVQNDNLQFLLQNESNVQKNFLLVMFPGQNKLINFPDFMNYVKYNINESVNLDELCSFLDEIKNNDIQYDKKYKIVFLIPRNCSDQYYLITVEIQKETSWYLWTNFSSSISLENIVIFDKNVIDKINQSIL